MVEWIPFTELQAMSGLQRPSAIKRWLQKLGVRYRPDGNGQPITTVDAFWNSGKVFYRRSTEHLSTRGQNVSTSRESGEKVTMAVDHGASAALIERLAGTAHDRRKVRRSEESAGE